jgi:hypothetical protein
MGKFCKKVIGQSRLVYMIKLKVGIAFESNKKGPFIVEMSNSKTK